MTDFTKVAPAAIPGFDGGYSLRMNDVPASIVPQTAAKLGVSDEATVNLTTLNRRWDKFLLPGTRGQFIGSADALPAGADSRQYLNYGPGVNKKIPVAVAHALEGVNDVMRKIANNLREMTAGNTSEQTRLGYVQLYADPMPVPLDGKPEKGAFFHVYEDTPYREELVSAMARVAEATTTSLAR